MDEQIRLCILGLRQRLTAKVVASLAGCSGSLVAAWEQGRPIDAKYAFALAAQLAERGDYTLLSLILPPGARVVVDEADMQADGCIDDEVVEGTLALAQIAAAHRGRNPDEMARGREQLAEALSRTEQEELRLRGHQNAGGAA